MKVEKSTLKIEYQFGSTIFYCFIDKIINKLKTRFSDNADIISARNPKIILILAYNTIIPFVKAYACDIECLKSESNILLKCNQYYDEKNNLKTKDIYQFHDFLNKYKIAFSEIYKFYSIAVQQYQYHLLHANV